ncbi:amyloid beta precursor protein binding family B member 2-like [Engraulis encrasicolus]|uniref:amyloid beta precursor protein binding family B member 2-like n=1 Tax=Engraulis encrasicolus TaxID=184585 RepID=UPI002FD19C21
MMSLHKPPLTRSGSTPATMDAANRNSVGSSNSSPSMVPPSSLNLRTSHNQSLAHETIKEGVVTNTDNNATVAMTTSQVPKSRHRNSTASMHSNAAAMDSVDSLPNFAPNFVRGGGRGVPTKSASSTSLVSMSSTLSLSLSASNPKLAKNGTNLQLKAEEDQHQHFHGDNKNLNLNLNQNHLGHRRRTSSSNIMVRRSSSEWLETKDNQNCGPMRRRTKSFLDYRREEPPVSFNEKQEEPPVSFNEKQEERPVSFNEKCEEVKNEEDKEEEKEQEEEREEICQVDNNEQVEEEEERERQVEEDEEDKEEEEEEEEEEKEELTTEKPLLPKLGLQDWTRENRVEVHLNLPQNHLLLAKEEDDDSPTQAQLKGMEGSYSYDRKPKKEPARSGNNNKEAAFRSSGHSPRHQPYPGSPLFRMGMMGMGYYPGQQAEKELDDDEDGDEDSSWTTLSQESPSMETPQEAGGVWNDGDLPPGWREVEDLTEVYFWHVPSGTTQRERPVSNGNNAGVAAAETQPELGQEGAEAAAAAAANLSIPPPNNSQNERPSSIVSDSSVEPVPSSAASSPSNSSLCYDMMGPAGGFINNNYLTIREETAHQQQEEANVRQPEKGSTHVKLRTRLLPDSVPSPRTSIDLDSQVFSVFSLGWMEVSDADMVAGRSSAVVSDCIRQLQHRSTCSSTGSSRGSRDSRDMHTPGDRDEGKPMLLVLQDVTMTLIDPADHTLLHSQPISCIRVWGVGRDHSRDFAYVARDKNTRVLKCHVFRCDAPAESIATSLHRICSKIMAERKNAKAVAGSSSNSSTDVPLQEFPTPKTELEQRFHVHYLGTTTVIRPIGMDMINGAIDTLLSSTGKEDWTPVILNVEDATVSVIKEKEEEEDVIVECRVRFLSFMGVGRDVHSFAFIMDTGNQHFQCHVFWCEPNAACVSEAVQSACVLRYQKCLVARSPSSQRSDSCSSPPPTPGSVTRRVTTSVKRGVQSLIDTLKQKKQPGSPELPTPNQ